VLAIAPRFTTRLVEHGSWPLGREIWGRTALALPSRAPTVWRDVLTGAEIGSRGSSLAIASALERFPVALLTNA
jgi:maltooligosyltrehalose synthase